MKPAKIVQFQALSSDTFCLLDNNGDLWMKFGKADPQLFHKSPRKRKKTTSYNQAMAGEL